MGEYRSPHRLAACPVMSRVFRGSESVAAGLVTKYELSRSYQRLFPDVYAPPGQLTSEEWILAAWLWSRRCGVVCGIAASAWRGAKWFEMPKPVELCVRNDKPPARVITRRDTILDCEIEVIRGVPVTTVARTAFDLARLRTERQAVARLDALARAHPFHAADVLEVADRHSGVKGRPRVAKVLQHVDPGAESLQESYLRLTLTDAGFPRPQTQIAVPRPGGRRYFLDMGWPELMVAVEYDGDHHRADRQTYTNDVVRSEYLASVGWTVIRVLADHQQSDIIGRVRRARDSRS